MATAVQIVISVDNAQAVSAVQQTITSFEQLPAALAANTAALQALNARLDGTALSMQRIASVSAEAVAGITNVGRASAVAGGEMQQMLLNIEAAQAKYASMARAPMQKSSNPIGDSFAGGIDAQKLAALGNSFANLPNLVTPASNAVRSFGGHTNTALDSVRLFGQELGIRIPRAMESMLSRMPAVVGLLSSMLNAMLLIGALEIFARLGEGAYNLYQKYISLTSAANDYNRAVQQHKDEDFINPHSIETATARINQATTSAKAFKQIGEDMNSGGWHDILQSFTSGDAMGLATGIGSLLNARKATDSGYKSQGQSDALSEKGINDQHETNLLLIEQKHAGDAVYEGQKKITEETAKKLAIDKENRRYAREQDSAVQGVGKKSGGAQTQQIEDDIARQSGAAQTIALNRQTTDRIIAMQNEAVNAGLEGEARNTAQRQQAVDAVTRKYQEGELTKRQADEETAAVELKFDNERDVRMQKQWQETQQMVRQSQQSGLTGAGRIVADHDNSVEKINTDRTLDPENAAARRLAAKTEENQKLDALLDDYTERVKSAVDSQTEASLSGFAKIDAARQKQVDDANKSFNTSFGGSNVPKDTQTEAKRQLQKQLDSIDADSQAQRLRLTEQIQQQTLDMDKNAAEAERRVRAQGLAGWVSDYQDSLLEIQAAQAEMQSKIDNEQKKNGGDPTQYEKQKVDADRIANSQIEELNDQMAHTLSSTLQSAFSDPVHFIQNKMKEMFFQIIADWIVQTGTFKSMFGNSMGSMQPGKSSGSFAGTMAQKMGLIPSAASGTAAHASGMGSASDASSGTVSQGYAAPGYSGTSSHSSGMSSASGASSGTASQSYAVPGYSGTSSSGSFAGTSGTSGSGTASQAYTAPASFTSRSAGMSPIAGVSDVSSLSNTGMSAAHALSTLGASSPTASSSAAWNDPDDPSSDGYTGAIGVDPPAASSFSAGGVVAAGVGAYTGTKGIISSFESGKASGILTGALSGAEMGGSIGMLAGPLGGAIGAGIGAVGGAAAGLVGWASGEGNRLQAQKYYKDTMRPQLDQEDNSYGAGTGGDVYTALSQLNTVATQGFDYMQTKFGASAAEWAKTSYIDPEVARVSGDISRLANAGHDYMAASAVQFHSGGTITGFGDFGTSSNEGMIHAMLGETVMHPAASAAHAPFLSAMNGGASPSDVAGMYLKSAMPQTGLSAASSGGSTHHWNVSAVDAKSFSDMLVNGGGMDAISNAANKRVSRYAGDAGGLV